MKKTSDGMNIARSQFAHDHKHNSDNDRFHYRLQAARYRSELDMILNFVGGKNSHYYYEDEKIEKIA